MPSTSPRRRGATESPPREGRESASGTLTGWQGAMLWARTGQFHASSGWRRSPWPVPPFSRGGRPRGAPGFLREARRPSPARPSRARLTPPSRTRARVPTTAAPGPVALLGVFRVQELPETPIEEETHTAQKRRSTRICLGPDYHIRLGQLRTALSLIGGCARCCPSRAAAAWRRPPSPPRPGCLSSPAGVGGRGRRGLSTSRAGRVRGPACLISRSRRPPPPGTSGRERPPRHCAPAARRSAPGRRGCAGVDSAVGRGRPRGSAPRSARDGAALSRR